MDPLSFEVAVLVVLGCSVAGLLLLLVEVVLVPGVGAPGFAGTTLILIGAAYAFWAGGLGWGLLTLAGAAATIGVALKALGFTLGPRIILGQTLDTPPARIEDLLGHEGLSLTPLRPTGLARIDGRRVDVMSHSEWLEAGTPVVVASVESSQAVVERRAGTEPVDDQPERECEHHG
jgi:membrane-bound serine protease (ClpP class)